MLRALGLYVGSVSAADPMLDTASQRPATGMDKAARQLILDTLEGRPERVVQAGFLRDRFADLGDYVAGVREVWGDDAAEDVGVAITVAINEQSTIPSFGDAHRRDEDVANALLLHMPEPDFRLAVFLATTQQRLAASPVDRITGICKARGIPWEFTATDGFVWIGDAEVEARVMKPALSAIQDPQLGGAKNHFDAARAELAMGTPTALRQSVHESACAVEGAMKVALAQNGVTHSEKDAAFALFGHLVAAKLVPEFMRFVVLGAASPRNNRAGHGAADVPHVVPQEMAEAVMASAATAVAYLHELLP